MLECFVGLCPKWRIYFYISCFNARNRNTEYCINYECCNITIPISKQNLSLSFAQNISRFLNCLQFLLGFENISVSILLLKKESEGKVTVLYRSVQTKISYERILHYIHWCNQHTHTLRWSAEFITPATITSSIPNSYIMHIDILSDKAQLPGQPHKGNY